ncbi:MAG: hypothetical protein R6V85_18735 [Polyangia bacterium]
MKKSIQANRQDNFGRDNALEKASSALVAAAALLITASCDTPPPRF